MVFFEKDYRFCVKASLQILREEREHLCYDSIEHNPTIYSGLHEFESASKRKLYFQAYLIEWIDNHWNNMADIMQRHKAEYTMDARKYMTVFFANYLSMLIDECNNKGALSKLAIPEMLKTKRKALLDMTEMADKWQENSDRLKAEKKKHKEQFARLLAEADKEGEDC